MDITEFFSRKQPRETSDNDKDEVPPPKSTDQGADGQRTTHLKTKSDSMSKVAKSLAFATKRIGRRSTHGSTAQIPKKGCSVVCAKVFGGHQQQQEVLGL